MSNANDGQLRTLGYRRLDTRAKINPPQVSPNVSPRLTGLKNWPFLKSDFLKRKPNVKWTLVPLDF